MSGIRLSTKARYGLKCCFILALENNPVPVAELSRRTALSEKYLEQLFAMLKKADIVNSTRGREGGYVLSKNPAEITVGVILNALEKDMRLTDCESGCADSYCPNRIIFGKIQRDIDKVLNSTTLQNMIEDYRCKKTTNLVEA